MSDVNLHISMTNLSKVDRLQSDAHKTPMENQAQNARLAEDESVRRMNMTLEADAVEEKRIDPDDKRREKGRRRNRKRDDGKDDTGNAGGASRGGGGDHIIDVQA